MASFCENTIVLVTKVVVFEISAVLLIYSNTFAPTLLALYVFFIQGNSIVEFVNLEDGSGVDV
jgi:uncharacterized membrane protein